ncbi:hypothetical protein [Halorhabdus sp. CUG00001]|uniref:hypothetical protein n=1 Tax=Halorhabdus sp. CUG00001 TaxID=2600297 RepID=UPI00131C1112|nr:hypothetical protein [Halorhabdus sp. CUG00001]
MKRALAVVALVVLIALAGCSGATGDGTPGSTSPATETEADVVAGPGGAAVGNIDFLLSDGMPVLAYEYDIEDYTKVIVEGPSGSILSEETLSPNESYGGTYVSEPSGGTYKVLLRKSGETIASASETYDGPSAQLRNVSADWDGTTLNSVNVTVYNDGDLPLKIADLTISAKEQTFTESGSEWIYSGDLHTLTAQTGYGNSIKLERSGIVNGEVNVKTGDGNLSGTFQRKVDSPNLSIESASPVWDGTKLREMPMKITNSGDLPAKANISIKSENQIIASDDNVPVQAGETISVDLLHSVSEIEPSSPGISDFNIRVTSEGSDDSMTFSKEFSEPNITLQSIEPIWGEGTLESVEYNITNSGDMSGKYHATLYINGEEWVSNENVAKGRSSETKSFGESYSHLSELYSGGDYNITVALDGRYTQGIMTQEKTIEGTTASLSIDDFYWISEYDGGGELYSVDLDVENEGQAHLRFDEVRLTVDGKSHDYRSATVLDPGESERLYLDPRMSLSSGDYSVKIELLHEGAVVIDETDSIQISD